MKKEITKIIGKPTRDFLAVRLRGDKLCSVQFNPHPCPGFVTRSGYWRDRPAGDKPEVKKYAKIEAKPTTFQPSDPAFS
jgi:hypothetical protein